MGNWHAWLATDRTDVCVIDGRTALIESQTIFLIAKPLNRHAICKQTIFWFVANLPTNGKTKH